MRVKDDDVPKKAFRTRYGYYEFVVMSFDVKVKKGLDPNLVKLKEALATVHPVFHVSIIKKCVGDPASIVSLEWFGLNESLSYEEVLVEISDQSLMRNFLMRKFWQVKKLRNKEIASVKVLWRNQLLEGATWEAEADMMYRYPHHFSFYPYYSLR
ncbi:hypothetical protein MTR67_034252 [Solanum verrucosum]|uniref:Chromo domain-containing protein n=1 Tax=Solanum verrucosum TaxID=315347 RepID=A0AAF0U7S5_SOLVR|nr:hypothetical protein MTR67_034252 [Solanum verrucosum]